MIGLGSVLLLDIGNSRIKWASFEGNGLIVGEPFRYKEGELASLFFDYWGSLSNVNRIVVSNVGGRAVAEAIEEWAAPQNIKVCFVVAEKQAYGVVNGYKKPEQLGVDRWVCLIAAHLETPQAVCIIDCGTAVTIDAINREGRHLGGIITPGLQLMKSSLLKSTSDISEAGGQLDTFLGCCTADAVHSGAVQSIVGLIERSSRELEKQYGEAFQLVLTGGDAPLVECQLMAGTKSVPDLALKGLSEIAKERLK